MKDWQGTKLQCIGRCKPFSLVQYKIQTLQQKNKNGK